MNAASPAVSPETMNTPHWILGTCSPENRLASAFPPTAKMCRPITVWVK